MTGWLLIHLHRGSGLRGITSLYLSVLGFIWLAQTGPRLVTPTFTVAETSAALGRDLEPAQVVGTRSSAGLFLGNDLDYLEYDGRGQHRTPTFVSLGALPEELASDYQLEGRYRINWGPQREEPYIHLYRRVPAALQLESVR